MDADTSFIMLTDDGNTLLSVRQGEDGALELLSTPVTILPSSVENWVLPPSPSSNMSLNQINLNLPQTDTQPYLASVEVVNLDPQNVCVPNEIQNQSVQVTNNLLNSKQHSNENISQVQNTTEINAQKKQWSKKPIVLKELSVSLEKISVPPKKIMHKKLGKSKKGYKIERQQPCFKCDLCGEEFKKQFLLQKHLHDHAQDKPHHCPKCPATFNVPRNFTLHMATHNIGEPKCPECGRKFARITSLKAHMVVHEMDESLYCTECDDTFTTKTQLESHLSLHDEKWSSDDCRRCRLCGKQFTKPVLYRQHLRDHYKLQMKSSKQTKFGIKHCTAYMCRICSKVFGKPSLLARHIRVHTGEKPFKCNLCNKGFTQKDSVKLHMAQHKNSMPHSCSWCHAKFKNKGNLISHIRVVHDVKRNSLPLYRCTYCACVFRTLSKRNSHVTLMHKDKQNVDDIASEEEEEEEEAESEACEAAAQGKIDQVRELADLDSCVSGGTLSKSAGNQGESVEGSEKEANAEESDDAEEGFVAEDEKENSAIVTMLDKESNSSKGKYVKIRQRVVNNRRFYECTFCKKPFKKPCDLMRHMRIHTNEKPFKCKECDQAFKLKYSLQRHEKRHEKHHKSLSTEAEENKCTLCNECFSSKQDLQKHINKRHKCITCQKLFTTVEEQNSHRDMHLKEIKELKKLSTKNKIPVEVQNLVKDVVLKEPLIITETDNGLRAQPQYRNNGTAHGKGRPYKCPSCPSAFMKMSHYKQHYRCKHTGERPFVCDFCDSAFTTKSGLKVHQQIHDCSKPYTCNICDNKFKTPSCLRRHYLTHTNKRPFMCPYCNKTYKSTFSCKMHMKTHKQEIAQEQLEMQKKQQKARLANKPVIIDDQRILPPLTLNSSLYSNDQISNITTNSDNTCYTVSLSSNNIQSIAQNIPVVSDSNIGSVQTLHAGETGSMTLSNYNGNQTLSPENIREIEEKLNQQLVGLGVNLTLGNVLKGNDQRSNTSIETTQEQPMLSIIYENGITVHSPVTVSASVNPNVYNPTYGNIDISQIALQNNNAMNIGIVQADSTNMINILSNAIQDNQSCFQEITNGKVGLNFILNQTEPVENNQVINESSLNVENTNIVQGIKNLDETTNLKCHVCNMQQFSTSELKEHLKIHNKKIEFECTYCGAKFRSAGGLTRHNVNVHEIQETHKCYECNQEFKTSLQLRAHIKEHVKKELELKNLENAKEIIFELESEAEKKNAKMKNKINSCQYCSKTFRKPSDLVRHVRTHTGERPYQCHLCDKSFAVKCTLDSHLKMHSGKKSFICNVCNRTFVTKGALTLHLRLHTGSKQFKCSTCDMQFRTSGALKHHVLSHKRDESKKKLTNFEVLTAEVEKLAETNQAINILDSEMGSSQNLAQIKTDSADLELITAIESQQNFESNQTVDTLNSDIDSSQNLLQVTTEQDNAQILAMEPQHNFVQDTELTQNVIMQQNVNFDQNFTDLPIPSEITFNTDATNGEVLTLDENNQLVANLQYLLANGLVTIQTQDPESNQVSLTTTIIPADFEKNKITEEETVPQVFFNVESPDSTVPITLSDKNFALNDYMVLQLDRIDSTVQMKNDDSNRKQKKSPSKGLKHVCETCGKSFKKPGLLERHKRTHTGERPFQCDKCMKSFSQKSTLQMHYRNHTGVKPHVCTHCGKSFVQNGNLHTHMKRIHKIDPVKSKRRTKQTTQFFQYDPKFLQSSVDDGKSLSIDDLPFVDLLK